MTSYFYDCKTLEEGKAKFRELAKKLHPDMGGSKEAMIELNKQWEKFEAEMGLSNKNSTANDNWSNSFRNYTSRSTAERFGWNAPNEGANFSSSSYTSSNINILVNRIKTIEANQSDLESEIRQFYIIYHDLKNKYADLNHICQILNETVKTLEKEVKGLKKKASLKKSTKKSKAT